MKSFSQRWWLNTHPAHSTILAVHGEMVRYRRTKQLGICISGMVSMSEQNTKYMLMTEIVWHGTQEKYQIFDTLGGRFNSEFGMEAFPHVSTIDYFVEKEEDKFPQSHVIDFHNKADGHERRLATYLVENLRTATDLEV
jgi:hypothetical protein